MQSSILDQCRYPPSPTALQRRSTAPFQFELPLLPPTWHAHSFERMARLLDQRSAIKLLEGDGWRRTAGGKHAVKMVKDGRGPVTLPSHNGQSYGKALTHAIAREAGLEKSNGQWKSPSRHMQRARDTGPRSRSYPDASRPPER
jgi:predicted RNA binding protein YcfA (HicA-like mRNA interferase family)